MKRMLMAAIALGAVAAVPVADAAAQGQSGSAPGLQDKGGMPPGQQKKLQSRDDDQRSYGSQSPSGSSSPSDQQASTMTGDDQQVVEALNNLSAEIRNLQQTTQIGSVQVVTIDQTVKGKAQVSNAIDQNAKNIQELQATIKNKQQIDNALKQQNLSVEDVVAVDVDTGGKVKIFAEK